jgi:hypothetical protein
LEGTVTKPRIHPRYTGHLRRDPETGKITGELVDSFGWIISLTAERAADGGYVLAGVLGEVPAALRVPGLDEAL